jgi:hypothetical protein
MIRALVSALLVAIVAGVSSCRRSDEPRAPFEIPAHEHKAPHGGTLVELGDEFAHVELVHDRTAGTLTAYVLDGEAEHAVRIVQPTIELRLDAPLSAQLKLTGRDSPLTGEKAGDTSEFAVTDDVLRTADAAKGAIVRITVRGQPFTDLPFTLPQ